MSRFSHRFPPSPPSAPSSSAVAAAAAAAGAGGGGAGPAMLGARDQISWPVARRDFVFGRLLVEGIVCVVVGRAGVRTL